ncbi:hypothetical protein RDWZM_008592 [Blomia tropicalis]|uniref:Uncharacterized protein n=1 Tax=Blomia tropicalis TaxID=40697 RepID=A0A9Q0RKH3_BLOTA|nr:hypothetical protein RDWZM_008592 [Blomia tropicalis]
MSQPLTILVYCLESVGRYNASFGLTTKLLKRGHRVIYLVPIHYKEKLQSHGFEVFVGPNGGKFEVEKNLGETFSKMLLETGIVGPDNTTKKLDYYQKVFFDGDDAIQKTIDVEIDFKCAMNELKPDLVIGDLFFLPPSLYFSNTPWIQYISTNPLIEIHDDELPPGTSGFPCDKSNQHEWAEFERKFKQFSYSKKYNDEIEKLGYQRFPNDQVKPQTQILSVYAFPDELNYPLVRNNDWYNIEVFVKNESADTNDILKIMPKEFIDDTLDVDIDVMKRLTGILANTNHKYIVSKGPRHEEFDLPRNMWGDRYLPQIPILKFVDLVITHGGNNSLTEIFVQAKPMIALPMFWDQYDNAQRLHETGYGIRLDPYNLTQDEMISSLDKLLNDEQLKLKLKTAANRILQSNADEIVCEKIENLMANNNYSKN